MTDFFKSQATGFAQLIYQVQGLPEPLKEKVSDLILEVGSKHTVLQQVG